MYNKIGRFISGSLIKGGEILRREREIDRERERERESFKNVKHLLTSTWMLTSIVT